MPLGLTVPIKGDAGDLDKTLSKASGGVLGFGGDVGATAASMIPMAAAAAGITVAIAGMTAAAAADRDEQQKLEQAITAAGAATGDYNAVVDEAISKGQDRAFSDSDVRAGLQSLVTATGDVTTASTLLAQAQDIARFANVDLATASDAVAKAQAGQAGPLTKLIPGLEKGATATDTLAAASAAAAGQADRFANSSEGMAAKGKDAFGELGETIGTAFLPILDALLPIVIQLIKLLGQLVSAVLPFLIPPLKLVALALTLVGKALEVVIGWIVKLLDWIGKAIGKLGDLLAKIGPLKDLGNLVGGIVGGITGSAVAAGGPSARGAAPTGTSSGGGSSITFNIQTTGDTLATEAAVARALRRVTRLNAGAPGWST
jgi:hypothetical protein